ncbi:MAG TPA: hypothetical protein PKC65_15420 [Pyrinomonadaceae bacterium]|nr:hypothetical protein [Pyrinomonadaceae bacterium]
MNAHHSSLTDKSALTSVRACGNADRPLTLAVLTYTDRPYQRAGFCNVDRPLIEVSPGVDHAKCGLTFFREILGQIA